MKKTDFQDVKRNNRRLVLDCLTDGCVSRAEIVRRSGLSKAAVSLIINDFIEEGCLVEKQILPSGNVGRPSIKLELVPDYCYFAGFSLFRKRMSVCVVNQGSILIDYTDFETEKYTSAEQALDSLWEELNRILEKHNIPFEKLVGIGVVAPAPLDYLNGIILTPPNFPLFQHYNIKEYFAKKAELPVFLDRNSVLLALMDLKLRKNQHRSSIFVYAASDGGIGSAIITNNQIFRGFNGHSGEFGHTCVNFGGPKCECGNIGCLEKVLSQKNLENTFGYSCDYPELVDRCYDGDKKALQVLDYIALNLSLAITNAVNLIDLDTVIIHGRFNYRYDLLFSKIKAFINEHSLVARVHSIEILPSLVSSKDKISSSASSIMKAYFEQRL